MQNPSFVCRVKGIDEYFLYYADHYSVVATRWSKSEHKYSSSTTKEDLSMKRIQLIDILVTFFKEDAFVVHLKNLSFYTIIHCTAIQFNPIFRSDLFLHLCKALSVIDSKERITIKLFFENSICIIFCPIFKYSVLFI